MHNGLKAITGSPVFTYNVTDFANAAEIELMLIAADSAGYPMGLTATTGNSCGFYGGEGYPIVSVN